MEPIDTFDWTCLKHDRCYDNARDNICTYPLEIYVTSYKTDKGANGKVCEKATSAERYIEISLLL